MKILVGRDGDDAARVAAGILGEAIGAARPAGGRFHLALAGGATPRRVYELLARADLDWQGVDLWLGDERRVPADAPEANARLVVETILDAGRIDAGRLHTVPWELGDMPAVAAYAAEMERLVPPGADGRPALDVAFLGLGEDGHTASLFPLGHELDDDGTCALVTNAPKPPPVRMTLTLPTLAAARSRLVLATGPGKADAVAAMLAGADPATPASLLPHEGTTLVLDPAAASELGPGLRHG